MKTFIAAQMAHRIIVRIRHILTVSAALALLSARVDSGPKNGLDLAGLAGNWEGAGQIVLPYTDIPVDIEGTATFTWDSANGYLRTAMSGTKLYLTYSDTGHFAYNAATGGVTWEIWNNWGKHVKHGGYYENGVIRGSRTLPEGTFEAVLNIISTDSMHFRFTFTAPDSTITDRAVLGMRRVKNPATSK